MKFDDYLASLDENIRDQANALVERVSEASPSHERLCDNIRAESHVDESFWKELIDRTIKFAPDGAIDDIVLECQRFFGANPCCGEPIKKHSPCYVGRLFSKHRLSTLHSRAEALNPRIARDEIEAMLLPPKFADLPIDEDDNILDETPLGSHGKMWSTFDDTDDGAEPQIQHANKSLKDVQCCFGLPYCDELSIFLEYVPPPSGIFFPTIADAYAGPYLNDAFKPSSKKDSCGRTRPNDDCPHNGDCGVPEVVHAVVTGSALTKRPVGLKK
ncbi:MAG: hypothetical protein AAGG48_26595 [Planctomycetota bacterium]